MKFTLPGFPGHVGPFNLQPRSNTRRAIGIHEGDKVDEEALLICAAVALKLVRRVTGEINDAAAWI